MCRALPIASKCTPGSKACVSVWQSVGHPQALERCPDLLAPFCSPFSAHHKTQEALRGLQALPVGAIVGNVVLFAGRLAYPGSLLHCCCRPVDEALAAEIREFRSPTDNETRMFYEIVIAPGYTPEGLAKLKGKSKTLRILEAPLRPPSGRGLRQVAGRGFSPFLLQQGIFDQECTGDAPECNGEAFAQHCPDVIGD